MEGGRTTTRSGVGAVRFLVEETAWLVLVALPWILAVALGWTRTGLLGLHAAVLVYVLVRERGDVPGWLALRFRDVVLGALAGGGILLIGVGYGLGLSALGIELPDAAAQLRALVPNRLVLLAWGALLVPVAEELLFRGRMLRALDALAGTNVSLVVTSLAFMLVHGIPAAFPAYFLFGVIFVFLRRRSGGLVAPIVAHAVNNFFGIAFAGG